MTNKISKITLSLLMAVTLNATDTYTVDDLILKSLENSPDIQVSKLEYQASQSRYDTAFSGYLPEVNLNASAGRVAQSATYNLSDVEGNILRGQLSLKQIIYDFGKNTLELTLPVFYSVYILGCQGVCQSSYDKVSFFLRNFFLF